MKLLIVIIAVLFPVQAYAYFDPGTGSMLIQVAVGLMAGIAVFWGRIKAYISSKLNRGGETEKQENEKQ